MFKPALIAAALLCAGCVLSPSQEPSASEEDRSLRGADTQGNRPPTCFMEWSAAAADSVLNCPEVAPPGGPR